MRSLLFILLIVAATLPGFPAVARQLGGDFDSAEERDAVTAAEIAHDNRDFESAYSLSRKALEEFPQSLEAIRTFVSVCSDTNRMTELAERFRIDPSLPQEDLYRAHYARGWLAVLLGDLATARDQFQRATDLATAPDFEMRRATLLVERLMGRKGRKELMEEYREFVAQYRNVGLAHVSYIHSFNFLDPGSRQFERAIKEALNLPEPPPQVYIAEAGRLEKEFWFDAESSLAIIDRGISLHPWNSELGIRRIYLLRRLGQTEDALAHARRWTSHAPNNGEFLNAEMELLSDLGRFEDAVAVLDRMETITYQSDIVGRIPTMRAELLQLAGRKQEAIDHLSQFVVDQPSSPWSSHARQVLYALQTSPAEAGVRLVPIHTYLQQKGNYCGPASISMLLGYWGNPQGQDAIAARVYTGIAGTPPQVLHHFARSIGMASVEFEGNEETWKRLIDAGYPILWLQMNGTEGGHYRLVVGYDDARKRWFVHDPNQYTRTEMSYESVDDSWILPSLRRSIVIHPAERAGDAALAGLGPTPILLVTNWVLYIATGANLFVGLFPALPLNLLVALLLAGICAGLLRRVTYPLDRMGFGRLVAWFAGPIAALNLMVVFFRMNEAVSALLALHLAYATLAVLLSLLWFCQRLMHDMLSPREACTLAGLVIGAWMALSFIDRDPWETAVPVAIFVLGLPVMLYPRVQIRRAEAMAGNGDTARALQLIAPWGLGGERYISGIVAELDAHLASGRFDRVERNVAEVLSGDTPVARQPRLALQLYQLYAQTLHQANPDAHAAVATFLAQPRLPARIRLTAEALLLYIQSELLESGAMGVAALKNNAEIDALLERLHGIGNKTFPGLPVRRARTGRPIQNAAFLLALSGAMQLASAAEDTTRRQNLWIAWSGRYGLMLRLLRGFEERSHRHTSTQVPMLGIESGRAEDTVESGSQPLERVANGS